MAADEAGRGDGHKGADGGDAARAAYEGLARKYRPQRLAELIGQDAMVRTLENAFAADRIAQAFILTGIRGTGKTTTARIIAKGLNCIGADGRGGPTTEPCGTCVHCRAIAEGRDVDVLEMDAASRTGVADIREIIESVRYRAAAARYKIYIIDEVHMLSTSAFNALLKTLEEPPPHVKFIFATTEIRKVPVTVLSRCQRFDLRRIRPDAMMEHLDRIAQKEEVRIETDALGLIIRAAEGSMRDAISLLDQAIATGQKETTALQVRMMLGLADRGRTLDLFRMIVGGDAGAALRELRAQYEAGADPLAVMRDLAEATHWISVTKVTPDSAEDPTLAPDERELGRKLAERLSMRALARMWQMLLKAIEEVAAAPNGIMAAEMAVIRLTHVAELPDPAALIRRLRDGTVGEGAAPGEGGTRDGAPEGTTAGLLADLAPDVSDGGDAAADDEGGEPAVNDAGWAPDPDGESAKGEEAPDAALRDADTASDALPAGTDEDAASRPAPGPVPPPASFDGLLDLVRARRDLTLLVEIENGLRLVSYAPGRIEFELAPDGRANLATRLSERLRHWTGTRWGVSVVAGGGAPTIAEKRRSARAAIEAEVSRAPLVRVVLDAFPGAEIVAIRDLEAALVEDGAGDDGDAPLIDDDEIDEDDVFAHLPRGGAAESG